MVKVFLTGATGYIGGQILYELLKHSQFEITVLVRSQEKADSLLEKTGNRVTPVIGDLDSTTLLAQQVQVSDLVISAADASHLASVQNIAQVLAEKSTKTIYVHTAGTSVICDELAPQKPAAKIYSDIDDIDAINLLPESQPHRKVDKLALEIQDQNPQTTVAIISPSTIFGKSDGYDHQYSAQIPLLVDLTLKNKRAFLVYEGKDLWSHIHIKDLGELYWLVISRLIDGEQLPTGKLGYYFGSYTDKEGKSTDIEHNWGDALAAVGRILKDKGKLDTSEVEQLTPAQIIEFSGKPGAPAYFGTNSRSRADNAKSIGWQPKLYAAHIFWESIEADVDYVLSQYH